MSSNHIDIVVDAEIIRNTKNIHARKWEKKVTMVGQMEVLKWVPTGEKSTLHQFKKKAVVRRNSSRFFNDKAPITRSISAVQKRVTRRTSVLTPGIGDGERADEESSEDSSEENPLKRKRDNSNEESNKLPKLL